MRRRLAALVATLLAALLVAGAPLTPRATAGAAELPTRDLHDTIVRTGGKLIFKGRVDPGHGPVVIQKKRCRTCAWRRYDVVRTTGDAHYWRVRIYAPRHGHWFWRGYVEAYDGYARSWTGVWRTYYE